MARRLIGLDIGTNAVTLAEVSPGTSAAPRALRPGRVAGRRDARGRGRRRPRAHRRDLALCARRSISRRRRCGSASRSPRAVVRQVEMPTMSRDELAGALRYQAADLIPIPMDEAVLDFAILGERRPAKTAKPMMQVLLVAAHEAPTARLVAAVEDAGFGVAAVDLVPLALIRALTHANPSEHGEAPGGEGIVSFGGGVTAIAVHEGGIPRFVRVLGTGGRELTDAIAGELEHAAGNRGGTEAPARPRWATSSSAGPAPRSSVRCRMLLDEVRSSLDYYRNQPGAVASAARRRDRWRVAAARPARAVVDARRSSRRSRRRLAPARDR